MMVENTLTGSRSMHSDNNKYITSANNRSNPTNQKGNNEHDDEEIMSKDKVESIVSKLNEMTKPLRTNLHFQLHDKLDEYYVEVINPLTDEIIREIPPKKLLDRYAAMADHMGLLVDEKV